MFSYEFYEISQNTFFIENLCTTASVGSNSSKHVLFNAVNSFL